MWCILDVWSLILVTVQTGVAIFVAIIAWKNFVRTEVQNDTDIDAVPQTQGDLPPLKLFDTSKQTTWLKKTANGIECHLDERRSGKMGGHKWTLSLQDVKIILETGDIYVHPGYKMWTGCISIGRHVNWLYSKKLFPEPAYLHHMVYELLKSVDRESGEAG